MLKVIECHNHHLHQGRASSLLDLIKVYQNCNLSLNAESVTFIVAENETLGVYGGAVLEKKGIEELHPQIGRFISMAQPEIDEVWTINICFHHDVFPLTLDFLELCQRFYQSLYEKLIILGHTKTFLCLVLSPIEYAKMRRHSLWSFVFEIDPQQSLDGFFHGILALEENDPEASLLTQFESPRVEKESLLSCRKGRA